MASSAADLAMSRSSSGMVSPRPMRSRTQSLSSDRPSTISHNLMSPPLSVSPEAAFIAASAASQIVTNDHDSHADTWYDQHGIEPAGETALVSQSALKLVNSFLDQLLFNFLQVSRATTLSALRPAVTEVLKPKLAKDAINNADEELREYLGGADEDDYVQPQGANPSRDWDLELVWKRTRLRCMVYSSLGDMEEEDEDLFMEQENLEIGADEQISDVISPAVAIFLTSVLEYMGELTLTVAGQAAYHRMRTTFEKDLSQGVRDTTDIADRIVVEDLDMERVALDRTLGRLWRGWKKRIRTPAIELPGRPFSRSSTGHARQESNVTDAPTPKVGTNEEGSEVKAAQEPVEEAIAEDVLPADIPLPLGEKDVDEIEVPGLAVVYSDDEEDEEDEEEVPTKLRPKSLIFSPSLIANGLPTPTLSQPQTPVLANRKRSNSVPLPGAPSFYPNPKRARKNSVADSVSDYGEKDDSASESGFEDAVEGTEESAARATETDDAPASTTDSAEDTEKEASETTTSKPLSKIITDTAAAGVAAVASVAGIAAVKGAETETDTEDAENTSKYEKAEIMTSSRVSVARSASPSVSEYSRPDIHKRSSSVASARLIDVAGPRSPSVSRSPSMDTTDRVRPASLSRTSSVSAASFAEESRTTKTSEASRAGAAVSASRSPVDRVRPTLQNATTISESDEEADSVPALQKRKTEPINFSKPSPSSAYSDDANARLRNANVAFTPGHIKQSSAPTDGYAPATKVTILGKTNAAGQFIEEKAPEVPRRASARHTTRGDGVGAHSLERTRTKDSSDEEQTLPLQSSVSPRPIHTSGSSASSGTGRHKPVRTSEEHAPSHAENVARNFEELIHSNQTITYTLTPENMRDIDSKHSIDSPIVTKFPRKSEEARAAQPRSRSSSTATEVKGAHRPTPLSSHPISESSPAVPPLPSPRAASQKSHRLSNATAREARVPAESTADFAEFIKSTGPPGETRPLPVRNANNANNANVPTSPSKSSVGERRVSSTTNRSRYQPREAAVDTKADNSDLIDFIRQGPPTAMSNPRIPRHVAPFRNTMDSEQMSAAAAGRAVDATIPEIRYSQASTSVTDNSGPSMQSSVNSSSALINKTKPPTMPSNKMFDDDDMMPKRKQRRVRDPYAIDFSDEDDDDDLLATPQPPPKKEESLADFLRNYEPPPEPPAPTPAQKLPKKKASAPSLMGRLTRNYGRDIKDSSNTPKSPTVVNDSRSLNSRTGTGSRGYVPIQVNMPSGYDKYGLMDGASRPRVSSGAGSVGRVPMKKFEPREAVSASSETADLAAFLRSSGPPDSGVGAGPVRPPAHQEESNGLSKMFSRRRRAMA